MSKTQKRSTRKTEVVEDNDEPLIDTTAALPLRSKKTERLQKRAQRKEQRKVKSEIQSFLDLPAELLGEVLSYLRPSDVMSLLVVNRSTRTYILDQQSTIAREIIARRYWVLSRCFQVPVSACSLSVEQQAALLSPRWQDRLKLNTQNPYQHIERIDPRELCTCMTCVLSWNNLCTIIDLAHWQHDFDNREPIPMIPRGRYPDWNTQLLGRNATVTEKAMRSPLVYARVLEMHLNTTTRTIVRHSKWKKKGAAPPRRLYDLTDDEIDAGTDEFLERTGPPSYEPVFHRDNYYNIGAFIPGRRWSKDDQRWFYPPAQPKPHQADVEYVSKWFRPSPEMEQRMDQYVEKLRRQLAR
ncbi:hypothetical protein K431DRAFT_323276 [Polychaeton citri CBS 116435]|uniref:F-box domain-containing protein n=1 Tax=Polychaeton citri CBS 116435 TaxID=1314669 RepID=A0A9P4UIU8_9PEZI|nr:hypothetical protein K431DRAFT_323276 [Polychaeton citri CBS 116435]